MKTKILYLILGAVVFTGIGVIATTITANDIMYDQNTTVKDKIDDLYDKTSSMTISLKTQNRNNSSTATGNFNYTEGKYKYFKILNFDTNSYVSECSIRAYNTTQATNVTLSPNTEYMLSEHNNGFWVNLTAQNATSSNAAICAYDVYLYNK